MSRMLFALPLAGVMMTTAVAYAQVTPPAAEQPSAAALPLQPGQTEKTAPGAGNASADCVDIGETRTATASELNNALEGSSSNEGSDASGQVSAAEGQSSSETQPVEGADSGTAPGGAGSSGWTGGLGGSDIGTSQAEELPTSPQQDHPAVASGLDPISGETAVEGPKAPPPPVETKVTASAAKPGC